MKLVKQVHIKNNDPKPLIIGASKPRDPYAVAMRQRGMYVAKNRRRDEADWKKEQD